MDTADFARLAQAYHGEGGLTEFRTQTLRSMIFAILALAFGILLWGARLVPEAPLEPLPSAAGLVLTAALTYQALRWGPRAAAATMALGLVVTLTVAIQSRPQTPLVGAYALIVLAASGASGVPLGALAAALATVALCGTSLASPLALAGDSAWAAALMAWGALVLAWLSSRPLTTAVEWAWSSQTLAMEKMEEARSRQAELGRLTKSLNEAYLRLEAINRELEEARQEAENAKRLKSEFAATVGHELRTPVNLIIGFTELLLQAPDDAKSDGEPSDHRSDLEVVHRNAFLVSQLIDDILDLSQVDAHRMALAKQEIDLATVIEEAASGVRALCAEEGLDLVVRVSSDLPRLYADPVRVRQVIVNLLFNAIRFTNHGSITVEAECAGSEVAVSVIDTGIGIPEDEIPKLFEGLHQPGTSRRWRTGSGLGLAVCKRFVELHGGTIVASSTPGVGSVFRFTLPLQRTVVAVASRRLPSPASQTEEEPWLTVLDQHGDASRLLQRYLDGYRVRRLRTPQQVSRLAARGELPVLVVTSEDASRRWRELQSHESALAKIPTVLCSLRTRGDLARQLGVADYLVKPATRDSLAGALKRLRKPVRRIVVVDDDYDTKMLLTRTLRHLSPDYVVAQAADGQEALRVIQAHRPDLVLLDLLMPVMDGYGVLERLRADEATRSITVIVITARGFEEETVVATALEVRCEAGLAISRTFRCLKSSLDVLHHGHVRGARALPGGSSE